MRISDWSSDVCSSDLQKAHEPLWGCRRRQLLKGGSDGKAGNTGTVSTESACGPCGWCWSMRARTDRYRRRSQSSFEPDQQDDRGNIEHPVGISRLVPGDEIAI